MSEYAAANPSGRTKRWLVAHQEKKWWRSVSNASLSPSSLTIIDNGDAAIKRNQVISMGLAMFSSLDPVAATAGNSIDEAGVIVCVNDKWEEKEQKPGHKMAD